LSGILKDKSRKYYHAPAITSLGKLGATVQAAVPVLVDRFNSEIEKYEQSNVAGALASIEPDGITALLQIFQNPVQSEASRLIACPSAPTTMRQQAAGSLM
jgi:hypothetical protein